MGLKSHKDLQAEKSPTRIVLPVLGAIIVVIILGFLIFGSTEKPAEPAEVVVEATPTPPPSPEELRQLQLNQLRNDMELAAAAQDFDQLATTASAVLEVEPKDGAAWSHLGRVQEKRGESAEALASYTKAIEFSEMKAFNLFLRARLLRSQGDLPAAIKDLEEGSQADPSSVGIANSLMIFKIQNGSQDEVRNLIESYEKTGIRRNAQLWLLGAAAMAMQDGKTTRATRCLEALQLMIAKPLLYEMLADPFFDPYRQKVEYRSFFAGGGTSPP